jgi:hypothetical protein
LARIGKPISALGMASGSVTRASLIRPRTASCCTAILSLWVYLGILFYLMLYTTDLRDSALVIGFGAGLVAAVVIWLVLGGYYLLTGHRRRQVQPA